jgi:hypothetical protein
MSILIIFINMRNVEMREPPRRRALRSSRPIDAIDGGSADRRIGLGGAA